jgi:hypothetical protein
VSIAAIASAMGIRVANAPVPAVTRTSIICSVA